MNTKTDDVIETQRQDLLRLSHKSLISYLDSVGYSDKERRDIMGLLFYGIPKSWDRTYVANLFGRLYSEYAKAHEPLLFVDEGEAEELEEAFDWGHLSSRIEIQDAAIQKRIDEEMASEHGMPLEDYRAILEKDPRPFERSVPSKEF